MGVLSIVVPRPSTCDAGVLLDNVLSGSFLLDSTPVINALP